MEEVDSIILHFLRRLDLNIRDGIEKLSELPVDTIIRSVSQCLTTINPNLKVPHSLPQGISHRIEVAAQLASLCKDIGYKNEVGYQTFLYYNESDLRQVFMFLIESLPTEGKQFKTSSDQHDMKTVLLRNISRKIEEEMRTIWIPHCCTTSRHNKSGDFLPVNKFHLGDFKSVTMSDSDKLLKILLKEKQSKIPQINLEINSLNEIINDDKIASSTPLNIDTTKSLMELKEEVILLTQKFNTWENERNLLNTEFLKIQKACELAESELKSVQNILINIDIGTNDRLVDIIKKVKYDINTLHIKSEELTAKSLSLKTDIEEIKMNLPQSQRNNCRKMLTTLKESAKSMKEEYNNKHELNEKLKIEFNKLNKGNRRAIYTKRILEIISNVDKQTLEIKKIVDDTKNLQKEINSLDGQLDRCFSVADETLFKDAKKDDQAKKAYKLLALLHSECNTIVTLVNDTGTLAREIVDLEDHVKAEKTKQTEETLKKIQSDISTMQEEV